MKRVFLFIASAALLCAGCAKEAGPVDATEEGQTVTVSVSASLSGTDLTKAVIDNDGNAAKVDHWILEVRDAQNVLFCREEKDANAGTLQQTFSVSLIKNQTYKLLLWADSNGGYYNTADLTDVKLVSAAGYVGNIDARDAFSACKEYEAAKKGNISVELYRPFAQINVMTTDLEALWKQAKSTSTPEDTYAKFEPSDLVLKLKVPTSFNVLTQTCGNVSTEAVTVTAEGCYTGYKDDAKSARAKNNYLRHKNPATLFMDYVFASKAENDIVDIAFQFTSNSETVSMDFKSVPLRANYRTNIKGKLLSDDNTVTVDINPAWDTPDYEKNID